MAPVRGLPPIATADARLLILGTLPSAVSLREQRYYAHPRNAFWPILGELVGFDARAAYEVRVTALPAARIALWDVLQTCTRAGSLDADIVDESAVPNDFAAFFAAHPQLRRVLFNGATAERLFMKHVRAELREHPTLELFRMPSTSPAHAAQSRVEKLAAWRAGVSGR